MHRTHFVPCLIGWGALLFTLTFLVGSTAHAQGPDITQNATIITMGVGTSQTYFSKNKLVSANNDAPKVMMIRKVENKPDQVIFEAIAPGRARVMIVDDKGNKDFIEVLVISDRVKELRDLIARTLPTASVNVSSTDAGTIVLTGFVLTSDDARVIGELARGPGFVNNVRIGGVQQVQLEVVVAVVNRSDARNLAFSWNVVGNNWIVNSLFATPLGVSQILTPLSPGTTTTGLTNTGSSNLSFGVLNGNSSIQGFLQALRTEGLTKILAEPRLTTLSGRPARILSGGNVQIIASGAGSTAQLSADFGTIVNFLPVVLGNGKIHLEVGAEVSTPTTSIPIPGAGSPGTVSFSVLKRTANAAVQIEDGQTLAIGGLIQNQVDSTINRVPILGDIPGIGMLFSQSNYTVTEEEMIILVTPRLVDPVDCTKIPKHLPGRETRVPDDFELFCELILEAPRGPRQVGLPPHNYQAAYKGAPNLGQYPCAGGNCGNSDTGCANGNCGATRYGAFQRTDATGPASMTMPTQRRADLVGTPTSNFRVNGDPDLPQIPSVTPIPAATPLSPSLGVPALPTPSSSREFEMRPQLPPVPR
jgi:pilus assembly protein CpaC